MKTSEQQIQIAHTHKQQLIWQIVMVWLREAQKIYFPVEEMDILFQTYESKQRERECVDSRDVKMHCKSKKSKNKCLTIQIG